MTPSPIEGNPMFSLQEDFIKKRRGFSLNTKAIEVVYSDCIGNEKGTEWLDKTSFSCYDQLFPRRLARRVGDHISFLTKPPSDGMRRVQTTSPITEANALNGAAMIINEKRIVTTFAFLVGACLALGIEGDDRRMELFTTLCLWSASLYLAQSDGVWTSFFRVNLVSAGLLVGLAVPQAVLGIRLGVMACEERPIILGGLFAMVAVVALTCVRLAVHPPRASGRTRPLSRARVS